MTATSDGRTLCGYQEQGQLGDPCYVPREEGVPYCARHAMPMFSVCSNCGSNARRLCPECLPLQVALCPDCLHLGPSTHGSLADHETPLSEGEPESGGIPASADKIWGEYVEQAVLSLRQSTRLNENEWETAERMVKTMATTSLIGLMSNLARARGEGGTG